jgi:hypothetical protein
MSFGGCGGCGGLSPSKAKVLGKNGIFKENDKMLIFLMPKN